MAAGLLPELHLGQEVVVAHGHGSVVPPWLDHGSWITPCRPPGRRASVRSGGLAVHVGRREQRAVPNGGRNGCHVPSGCARRSPIATRPPG